MVGMRWLKLVVAVVVLVPLAAFFVQNSSRTTVLSFDLGVAAWALSSPISVPSLMAACFFAGALAALGWGLWARAALARKVRVLEQELALRGSARSDGPAGWGG